MTTGPRTTGLQDNRTEAGDQRSEVRRRALRDDGHRIDSMKMEVGECVLREEQSTRPFAPILSSIASERVGSPVPNPSAGGAASLWKPSKRHSSFRA